VSRPLKPWQRTKAIIGECIILFDANVAEIDTEQRVDHPSIQ